MVALEVSSSPSIQTTSLRHRHRKPSSFIILSRVQLKLPQQIFVCKAKTLVDESGVDGGLSFASVPSSLLVAEREEAKAVLSLFLRKQGLSNAVAARIINKSDLFIDHLILKLHTTYKARYLVGRELTTLEIRDALTPYLESLLKEHGDLLIDVVENFPNPPSKERSSSSCQITFTDISSKKERAIARVCQQSPEGLLSDQVIYLMDLGVPRSNIPTILNKRPQLCGISLPENLKPMMNYLEGLGLDKSRWAKVISRFPALLTYSRQKVKATVDYLHELGVSEQNIGKILTRCPQIISYSVDDNLRPTAKYFRSLGVNISSLILRCPQTFGLSIEASLKPVTEFFLEKGYSIEDIGTMVSRYGALYTFSIPDNLLPKWNFFLTMDYPRSELVKFPHYFSYSLEARIKPRYRRVKECGVRLVLNQVLSVSDSEFEKTLERKMSKQHSDEL
ncbi:hypothetical protein J5N97_021023 [Dioscorea zingiberensis]|uniref:Transcription termination factor MTERF5, chloroplastic n=1 Tax=Dioscorea zingiberensis TaxID=325984 RepID=A0A9D5CHP0_9LILI|nr:hypothetical protein J5N97_021023 [Dioscorea zingiberensis]